VKWLGVVRTQQKVFIEHNTFSRPVPRPVETAAGVYKEHLQKVSV